VADTDVELAQEVRELLNWDRALAQRVQQVPDEARRAAIRQAVDELVGGRGAEAAAGPIQDFEIPVHRGAVRLRVYFPADGRSHGALFHIHGGGFVLGGIDWAVNHVKCAHIAAKAGCAVATVDYRLAPEFPYPTAVEDCFEALVWLDENASRLGIDDGRLMVGGESAGGNLAAVIALMARDRNGPSLGLQLLEVPVVDMSDRFDAYSSMQLFGDGYGLDTSGIESFIDAYLPEPTDRREPYASPLWAPDLSGVAPAHIFTAEYDPLRDAGEAYARRLHEAGVPTILQRFAGQTHGSSVLWDRWAPATEWMDAVVGVVRAATTP
jgi:acetyl esterase